ncbi:MAG: DUF5330 domain-containing protein [Pseudolabrys sp.]
MFFLLRMAFWLGVVCVLLPNGGASTKDANLDTAGAVSAASAAVSDAASFCSRQPEACVVGGKVAAAIGQKAEAGARTLYEIISAKLADNKLADNKLADKSHGDKSGSTPVAMRGTLTPSDMAPGWHAPVPLPPRREARAGRPAA